MCFENKCPPVVFCSKSIKINMYKQIYLHFSSPQLPNTILFKKHCDTEIK